MKWLDLDSARVFLLGQTPLGMVLSLQWLKDVDWNALNSFMTLIATSLASVASALSIVYLIRKNYKLNRRKTLMDLNPPSTTKA